MIKVNLLRDHTVKVQKKQRQSLRSRHSDASKASSIPWIWSIYIVVVAAASVFLGQMWISSGKALEEAKAENQRLEKSLKELESLRNQFVQLEQRKQERQNNINIIQRLLESQTGPVRLMNAIIQAVPQNRNIWLTSLEQTAGGVTVRGETRIPEVLPDFMRGLEKSGIFADIDIEVIERRDEISNFSILCTNKQ